MGEGRNFESGAYRDQNADKLDWSGFLSPNALRLFAEYMHRNRLQSDGRMRGSDNWKLGIPISSYKESLIRHIFDFWQEWDRAQGRKQIVGNETERAKMIEALCGALFNLQGMLHELEKWDERDKNLAGSVGTGARAADREVEIYEKYAGTINTAVREAREAQKGSPGTNWGKGQAIGEAQCQKVPPALPHWYSPPGGSSPAQGLR